MQTLFGADGIRGIIEKYPLRIEDVERLGRAVAAWLRQSDRSPVFLVGADTRESSHRLKAVLCDGLTRAGIRIVDAGILPTAAISFLIAFKNFFAAGAMVSASHNPICENGIKFFDQRGVKIHSDTERAIDKFFFGDARLPFEIRRAPGSVEPDYASQYAHALAREYHDVDWSSHSVVVDCANGAAYTVAPQVLQALNVRCTLLNVSPDGTNINLQAGSESVRNSPRLLAAQLQKYNAQVGIAFDGDADRVLFVDRANRVYDGDMLLAMLALRLQAKQQLRQDTVVYTQMSNSGLEQFFKSNHIFSRLVRNGDKNVTNALLEHDLTLGGEEVGHIIARTDHTRVTGDGLRAGLMVLNELNRHPDLQLGDLAPGMFKWPQINVLICLGERTQASAGEILGLDRRIEQTRRAIGDITRLECRPASTEAAYRIMIEARATPISILARHALDLSQHIQRNLGCAGMSIRILDCVNGGVITPDSWRD
jgi:phosphoglucosamine mutase